MIKYAVYSGWVRSKNDNDSQYIGSHMLMDLYHVNPKECVIITNSDGRELRSLGILNECELIVLKPLYSGKYDEFARKMKIISRRNLKQWCKDMCLKIYEAWYYTRKKIHRCDYCG